MAFGLKINLKKNELMYQHKDISILIAGQVLTQVNRFKYLGSTITTNDRLDTESDIQTSNASMDFGRLKKWVWLN